MRLWKENTLYCGKITVRKKDRNRWLCKIEGGCLYSKYNDKLLWVVPKQLRFHIPNECHDKARLMGTDKMIGRFTNLSSFLKCANFRNGYIKTFNKQPEGRREGDYNYLEIKPPILFGTIHVDYMVSVWSWFKRRSTHPISSNQRH